MSNFWTQLFEFLKSVMPGWLMAFRIGLNAGEKERAEARANLANAELKLKEAQSDKKIDDLNHDKSDLDIVREITKS